MQKTKKGKLTLIVSVIACLGLALVALTAVGITYTRYVSSSPSSLSVLIPEWSFDLDSGDKDFNTKTSAKLHPDQSVYDSESNNDRESLSIPIPVALLINKGDVNGDVYLNAYLDNDQPYIENKRYVDNKTYEEEFSSHFIFNLYYCANEIEISDDEDYDYSNLLTQIDNDNPLTLYSPYIADESTTLSSVYLYLRVIWKSDINGNGDNFDSWVGRGIDKINIDIDCDIYQNGEGSIVKPTLTTGKLGVAYTATSWLYFDGSISSNHLGVTEDYQSAIDVTVYEYSNGLINLSYTDENGKTLYLASNENPTNTSYMSSSTIPYDWYFNDAYTTSFNGNDYFIGQYNNNQYLACYLTSNMSSSNYRSAELYTSEPTPEGVPSEDDPTYKLGAEDGDSYKYFNGQTTGSTYLGVTENYSDATDVYISSLTGGSDNTCTLSFYNGDTLNFIVNSGTNSTSLSISTTSYTWAWNWIDESSKTGYFYDPNDLNRFIGCQADGDHFGAFAATNLESDGYICVVPYTFNHDTLSPESIEIYSYNDTHQVIVGQTLHLYANISPSTGVNEHIIWDSSDTDVASVSDAGLVSALKEGKTIISATSAINSSIYDTFEIEVVGQSVEYRESETIVAQDYYSSVTSGSLDLTTNPVYGDLVTLTFGENGNNNHPQYFYNGNDIRIYTDNQIYFTPVDEKVAKISKIEISYSGTYYGQQGLSLTDSSGSSVGEMERSTTSGGTITISNINSEGTLTLTNSKADSSESATQLRCLQLTIYYESANTTLPSSITITSEGGTNELTVNHTLQLTASISPSDANNRLLWSSSNDEVASVDDSGLVKGYREGEATITATSILDSSIYGEFIVYVVASTGEEETLLGMIDMSYNDSNPTNVNSTTLEYLLPCWTGNSSDFTGVSDVSYTYLGANSNTNDGAAQVLQVGSSSNLGSITLSFSQSISRVELYGASYGSAGIQVNVNGSDNQTYEYQIANADIGSESAWASSGQTLVYELDSYSTSITIATYSSKSSSIPRAVIKTIAVYYYA